MAKVLFIQVLNAAWDAGISISSGNTRMCHERDYYTKVVVDSKPYDDPESHHLASFTYSKLSPFLMERNNFEEFKRFVSLMHGKRSLHFSLIFIFLGVKHITVLCQLHQFHQ